MTDILKSLRPQHWLKNIVVLAPVFFAGEILNAGILEKMAWAFGILSLSSSANYIVNDVLDRAADRIHPLKAHRPIAAGKVPVPIALILAALLLVGSLAASFQFTAHFVLTILAFISLQLAYSLLLKRLIILDVMAIAATFSLRVFAGAFIIPVPISSWLILTTVTLALLIAIGKRRAEITLLTHRLADKHREVLSHYPNLFLDGLTFMMAASTLVMYSLFAFNQPEPETRKRLAELLPQTLSNPKWLMITIPFVIYGVFRYLYVIYEKKEGGSPERILIRDWPLLLTVLGWVATASFALYIVGR